jgi:hypothetical protein
VIRHTFSDVVFYCEQPGLWRDVNGRWEIRFSKDTTYPFRFEWHLYDAGRHVDTRSAFWDYQGYCFKPSVSEKTPCPK